MKRKLVLAGDLFKQIYTKPKPSQLKPLPMPSPLAWYLGSGGVVYF